MKVLDDIFSLARYCCDVPRDMVGNDVLMSTHPWSAEGRKNDRGTLPETNIAPENKPPQ